MTSSTSIIERDETDAGLRSGSTPSNQRVDHEIGHHIAERQRAESALRSSEERYRLVMQATNDVLWDWDLSSDVTLASRPFGKLILDPALEREDSLMRMTVSEWHDLMHPDDRGDLEARILEIRSGRRAQWQAEYRLRRADGSYVTVLDRASVVRDAAGAVVRAVGALTDITERKWVEQLHRAARAEAEAASRAKSEFLANMSHEIRTPMNGVLGMLELVLDTDMTEEQRDYITTARSSAESLLSVINDVLDFSKIEAGKLELDPVPFSLNDAMSETIATLALRAHKKKLELALQVDDETPDALLGDVGRIRQVVVNLVGNAIKFTERGEVVVSVGVDRAAGDDVGLHIAVRDTGIGIPVDKQALIFDAFAQADASITREFGGTGLGLAISARLVGMMGGRLWVDSVPGEGSTFHFTVACRRDVNDAARRARTVRLTELRNIPALVVDDNATNRRILEEMLRSWGMRPTCVADGAAALAELDRAHERAKSYPLVLVDAQMPQMDGFQLAEAIKRHALRDETTIMMLSSAALSTDKARCRDVGISRYLVKPVSKTQLLNAVLETLGAAGENPRGGSARESRIAHTARPLRVLLAEDNPVNRQLAVALLTKRGHAVTTAATGREAVAAWQRDPFDVVLMDVQMPEMDGLAATAVIREQETRRKSRTPIVAMTARAMSGDRCECLAAGMDGYISKPINAQALFDTMEQLVVAPDAAPAGADATPGIREAVIDVEALRRVVEGDDALLHELIGVYISEAESQLGQLRDAVRRRDATAIGALAHSLKGASANLYVTRVAELARQLEAMARSNVVDDAPNVLCELTVAFAGAKNALGKLA